MGVSIRVRGSLPCVSQIIHSFVFVHRQSISTYSAVGNELVAKAHRWKAMVPVSQGLKSTPWLNSTQPRYIFVLNMPPVWKQDPLGTPSLCNYLGHQYKDGVV